jgi:hypothetical protein
LLPRLNGPCTKGSMQLAYETRHSNHAHNAYSTDPLKAMELARPTSQVQGRTHALRQTNPTAFGSRSENAPNEPNHRWGARRKCAERTQLRPIATAMRNSTKRTQGRERLVRTCVLEMRSDDAGFLRNEAKSRSPGPHRTGQPLRKQVERTQYQGNPARSIFHERAIEKACYHGMG